MSQAWADSFARVATNKKAIAEGGWGPLNYNCLLHPEIAATRHRQETGADSMHATTAGEPEVQDSDEKDHVLNQLNLTRGLAGSLIASIVDVVIRDDARNGVNRDEIRQKRIASAKEVLASKRQKYSAGPHAASGQFIVGPDVLDNFEERERAQEYKVSESNGDLPTPTTRPLLLRRLQETCGRNDSPEPPAPSMQRVTPESEQQQNEILSEVCDDQRND